ncbi:MULTISPECIES: hypothetical protein [Microbacterium]|uniref:Uncharacterized protein n=1 Tax=Microbacterium trichothecenolyticum TaxID=69370 RepID=A0A0M2H7V9_MICTR|nr:MULTISPECIES: hypothetical protein [Microbacterium]KJL42476.1 hypothetical protein RS82_02032 [Microbacterium trichothecenolyticum]MDR7190223.1 hypothetical protein [Microbacterium sp. BE35]
MTDEKQDASIDEAVATEEPPQYGVGPFSIREVALAGTWIVAFVVSFFPIYGPFESAPSVWTGGIDWILMIGVPTIAVFLIVLRRLSPQGIRRVGSLGIDQFASVAFSVASVLWLSLLWNSFVRLSVGQIFLASWVVWVEFFLMLAGVVLTVAAPFIGPFAQDFQGRPEVPAHRSARPVRPVSPRPAPVRPEPAAEAEAEYTPYAPADTGSTATPEAAANDDFATTVIPIDEQDAPTVEEQVAPAPIEPAQARESFEHVENPTSTVEPAAATAPQHQAFWALVPEERDIVDEIGIPVFRIGPSAWALVIEDRGEVFVVRHEDGRIGYLHDVSGVTRG